MCEENGVGESQVAERQRKRMCERWSVQEGRISVGERSGHSHSNGRKRNMIIRMLAVKRWRDGVCRREGLACVKDQDILTVMDGNVI